MRSRIIALNLISLILGPLIAVLFMIDLGIISPSEAWSILFSPGMIGFIVIALLTGLVMLYLFMTPINRWLKSRDESDMAAAQKAIVIYQKLSIADPLILSTVAGLLLPGLIPDISPEQLGVYLSLCLSLTFLMTTFMYILFLQNLEKYTWDLPYSQKYRSLSYLPRNLLVFFFTVTGAVLLLIVSFEASMDSFGLKNLSQLNKALILPIITGVIFCSCG